MDHSISFVLGLIVVLQLFLLQDQPPRGGGSPIIIFISGLLLLCSSVPPQPLQPHPGGAPEAGHPPHLAGEGASAAAEREGQVTTHSCSLYTATI